MCAGMCMLLSHVSLDRDWVFIYIIKSYAILRQF